MNNELIIKSSKNIQIKTMQFWYINDNNYVVYNLLHIKWFYLKLVRNYIGSKNRIVHLKFES